MKILIRIELQYNTTHKKAFHENPAASTSTLHAERVSSTYIIRFILKQNVFVVFCECTRNIHTCIIDIRNVFEEALAIQKLNSDSTHI